MDKTPSNRKAIATMVSLYPMHLELLKTASEVTGMNRSQLIQRAVETYVTTITPPSSGA